MFHLYQPGEPEVYTVANNSLIIEYILERPCESSFYDIATSLQFDDMMLANSLTFSFNVGEAKKTVLPEWFPKEPINKANHFKVRIIDILKPGEYGRYIDEEHADSLICDVEATLFLYAGDYQTVELSVLVHEPVTFEDGDDMEKQYLAIARTYLIRRGELCEDDIRWALEAGIDSEYLFSQKSYPYLKNGQKELLNWLYNKVLELETQKKRLHESYFSNV